jgi:Flp pilus assembly pilin Flp
MSEARRRLLQNDRGQVLTEYALILAVIVIVAAGSLGLFAAWIRGY